ncbi:MAG: septum formation initiator family protein [Bacteroidales bacterium]|nr:septum formation initiator family protein [Bacteroidales bacterium]
MKQDKEIRSSFLRYAIVVTIVFLIFLLFKKDSIITWVQARVSLRAQEKQIEWYGEDNARLDRKIEAMSQNKDTLEQFAREEFYFSEEGDDVYIVE